MKKLKYLLILLTLFLMVSCITSYTEETIEKFDSLKAPVTVFSVSSTIGGGNCILKDGDNNLHFFGDMSSLSNTISSTFVVGDTLK